LVYKKALGGYKANMIAYIIAILSYKSKKKLNLDKIWAEQGISENLTHIIDKLIPIVWEHINDPQKAGMNIGEWCKKSDCWSSMKDKTFDIDELLESELSDGNNTEDNDLIGQDLTPQEIKIIENASSVLPEVYIEIAKWAKHKAKLTPFDRKLIHNIGIILINGGKLTLKQAKNAMRIQKSAVEHGFTE
jgi:AIPR protein